MYNGDRRIYAAMLEKADEGVGMLLAELEKIGQLDNTLFVLSGDNGGERFSDSGPLFNHKTTLWEGGIRVPAIMRWPARLPKGKVVQQAGITMDLTATFAAVAGAKAADGYAFDGINLLPILTGAQPEQTRTFCWRINRTERKQKAIRHGQWKYVQEGAVEMLFDLSKDIGERRDVFYQNREVFEDLKRRLAAWEADLAKEKTTFIVR